VSLVWLNGEVLDAAEARISVADRGLTLADGVFETIRCEGGAMLWLSAHLRRLAEAAALLRIPVPLSDSEVEAGLAALLVRSGLARAALRLTLTRGPAARGLWPPGEPIHPTLLATIAPLAERAPVRAVLAGSTRRNAHSPLSRLKSLAYGDAILARIEAESRGADEALLLNTAGRVACASIGNIFVCLDGAWITPPAEEGILPGLARARLIPLLGAKEQPLAVEALRRAERLFVSNSLSCTPARSIDGGDLPPQLPFDPAALYR
jgi:branched-chain amino acid aminotransferase/4-amino-4-deoxychorismate lyase